MPLIGVVKQESVEAWLSEQESCKLHPSQVGQSRTEPLVSVTGVLHLERWIGVDLLAIVQPRYIHEELVDANHSHLIIAQASYCCVANHPLCLLAHVAFRRSRDRQKTAPETASLPAMLIEFCG